MRGITTLGDVTVAFGMNRNVYVSNGASWRRFEDGFVYYGEIEFFWLMDSPGALNAVARTGDELVTVGEYGEIWRSPVSHAAWVEESAGTTLALEAVFSADGEEFIVGQSGTFLRNRVQQQGIPTLHLKDGCGRFVSAAGVLHRFEDGVFERLGLRASKLSASFGLVVVFWLYAIPAFANNGGGTGDGSMCGAEAAGRAPSAPSVRRTNSVETVRASRARLVAARFPAVRSRSRSSRFDDAVP